MNRFARCVATALVLAVVASCSSNGQESGGTFVSPEPADEFGSGVTIGFIPKGFSWVWNEGHETATFHTFQTQDESEQLSVGIQISPPPDPGSGQVVTRGGREFTVYDEGTQIRVTEDAGNDTRIDVVSHSLDTDILLRIAESVTYDPDRVSRPAQSVESFCDQAVPVLSRDDLGDDPSAMQQQMDDLSTTVELLPDDQSAELNTQIDALNEQLDLAFEGKAENGWSNAEIVDTVGSLCGEEGLVTWIVQP